MIVPQLCQIWPMISWKESWESHGSVTLTMLRYAGMRSNWANSEIINPGLRQRRTLRVIMQWSPPGPAGHRQTHTQWSIYAHLSGQHVSTNICARSQAQAKNINNHKHTNSLIIFLFLSVSFSLPDTLKHRIHTRTHELKLWDTQNSAAIQQPFMKNQHGSKTGASQLRDRSYLSKHSSPEQSWNTNNVNINVTTCNTYRLTVQA